jgi:hypothetical protein
MKRILASLALLFGLAVAGSAFALDPNQCANIPNGFVRDGNTNCGRMMTVNADGSINTTGSFSGSIAPFTPTSATSNTSLAVTTASANVALPAGTTVVVQNTGANTAFVTFSVGAGTATTSGYPVLPNTNAGFAVGSNTFINAITAASTTTILVSGGTGFPAIAGGGSGGGGGGGGAVTVADGADVTQGALADAACATDNGTCSINAVIKRNNQRATSIITALGSPFQAGGSIGNTSFGISGTLPAFAAPPAVTCSLCSTSALQSAVAVTAGAVQANRMVPYTPAGAAIDLSTPSSLMGVDGTNIATAANPVPNSINATTSGGCTPGGLISTASTNSTNIKASAGKLCGGTVINTTATVAYVRFYNLAAAPTCSSATGAIGVAYPIPASASGAGTVLDVGPWGVDFTTGIGFCITGGGSSTDNTSAVAGVYLNYAFK